MSTTDIVNAQWKYVERKKEKEEEKEKEREEGREMKAHAHTKNCKQMFIEALFVIPQDLK